MSVPMPPPVWRAQQLFLRNPMKTLFAVLVFPCSLVCTTVAQLAPEPSASAAADYSVIERGPHHRVLAKVTWQTDALGRDTAQTNSYTELLGGMHYLKPKLSDSCGRNVHLRIKEAFVLTLLVEWWTERRNCLVTTLFSALNAATWTRKAVLVHTPSVAMADRWVSY